jgi:hypothetical protein
MSGGKTLEETLIGFAKQMEEGGFDVKTIALIADVGEGNALSFNVGVGMDNEQVLRHNALVISNVLDVMEENISKLDMPKVIH